MNYKQEHLKWIHREEVLACQKSRIKWLAKKDSNTSFFHASMRVKRKSKRIENMRIDNGGMLDSSDAIHEGSVIFSTASFGVID